MDEQEAAKKSKAVQAALDVITGARTSIEESIQIIAEDAQPILEIIKLQPIEIEVDGITVSVKVKGASGGTGTRGGKKLLFEGKEFPSAKALCEFCGIDVRGDSAIRKLAQNKVEYTEV